MTRYIHLDIVRILYWTCASSPAPTPSLHRLQCHQRADLFILKLTMTLIRRTGTEESVEQWNPVNPSIQMHPAIHLCSSDRSFHTCHPETSLRGVESDAQRKKEDWHRLRAGGGTGTHAS